MNDCKRDRVTIPSRASRLRQEEYRSAPGRRIERIGRGRWWQEKQKKEIMLKLLTLVPIYPFHQDRALLPDVTAVLTANYMCIQVQISWLPFCAPQRRKLSSPDLQLLCAWEALQLRHTNVNDFQATPLLRLCPLYKCQGKATSKSVEALQAHSSSA